MAACDGPASVWTYAGGPSAAAAGAAPSPVPDGVAATARVPVTARPPTRTALPAPHARSRIGEPRMSKALQLGSTVVGTVRRRALRQAPASRGTDLSPVAVIRLQSCDSGAGRHGWLEGLSPILGRPLGRLPCPLLGIRIRAGRTGRRTVRGSGHDRSLRQTTRQRRPLGNSTRCSRPGSDPEPSRPRHTVRRALIGLLACVALLSCTVLGFLAVPAVPAVGAGGSHRQRLHRAREPAAAGNHRHRRERAQHPRDGDRPAGRGRDHRVGRDRASPGCPAPSAPTRS